MIYFVLDVGYDIIRYSNKKDYGISNFKLQKILYFVQAYFLIKKKEPCFQERIEAWDFGPVVPEAYQEWKQFGSCDIPTMKYRFQFDKKNPWNTKKIMISYDKIREEDKKIIYEVVDLFRDYSATYLVALTQRQSPWIQNYVPNQKNEISLDSIIDFFSGE